MNKLLILAILLALLYLVTGNANAAEFYFEIGVGVHNDTKSQPEVDLHGPLGRFAFGVEAQNGWLVEYEHISSIPDREIGSGLDIIWFSKRVYF